MAPSVVHGYACNEAGKLLEPFERELPELGENDARIAVTHCGVCHTDLQAIDDYYGITEYPLVPGHEVVGHVAAAGRGVTNLKEGDRVGVGWQGRSCGHCEWCRAGEEQLCMDIVDDASMLPNGGFSTAITVDHRFAYPLPASMPDDLAAVLMCAGITAFNSLRGLKGRQSIGILGVGGLGHLAIQFAHALGHEVTAISTSPDKEREALGFGAGEFVVADPAAWKKCAYRFDVLLCTAPGSVNWPRLLEIVKKRGRILLAGFPDVEFNSTDLVAHELSISGSFLSNRAGFREMLDFVASHPITAAIETMPMASVNEALQRVRDNKARYRIVLVN
ncbi:MAG TPA: NAD(P)-dependent alcohol dehydrogenase [Anaerolineales bacterium]